MVEGKETTHWRLWASYKQSFGSVAKIQSHFEYGSVNDYFQKNPLRIHNFTAQFNLKKDHTFKLGRIVHWSGLIQARVDGGEYVLQTEKVGFIKVLGGIPADIGFDNKFPSDNRFLLASWGSGGLKRNIVVSYWTQKDSSFTSSYLGSNWKIRLFSRLGVSGSLAWDLKDQKLYHSRLLLTQRFGQHLFTFGIRNKRHVLSNPYTWVDSKITIPAVVSMGLTSSLSRHLSLWNQLLYRMGKESGQYVRSSLLYKAYQLTIIAGSHGDRRLIGGGVGITKKLTGAWKLGTNIMINAFDYGEIIDLQFSKGLYGWIAWEPNSSVKIRLYGRYQQNPFYTIDGRGGLIIHVAL